MVIDNVVVGIDTTKPHDSASHNELCDKLGIRVYPCVNQYAEACQRRALDKLPHSACSFIAEYILNTLAIIYARRNRVVPDLAIALLGASAEQQINFGMLFHNPY